MTDARHSSSDQKQGETKKPKPDKGTKWLPLVYQEFNETEILEQPVDFTMLAEKYSKFATSFIEKRHQQEEPFFLYVPFSHVQPLASSGSVCPCPGRRKRGCSSYCDRFPLSSPSPLLPVPPILRAAPSFLSTSPQQR